MARPSSLTRRELIALAGVGVGALILGEGVLASEAINQPASPTHSGSSEPSAPKEAIAKEAPSSGTPESLRENATASPEETADPAAKPAMSVEDLPWNLRLVN